MLGLVKMSLSEQIYQRLKKDIILQKIECGTKLTIKEFEIEFNVSSTPVREALTRLSQEGLIEFSANLGAKVKDFTLNELMEITDICELFDLYALEKAMDTDDYENLLKDLEHALNEQINVVDIDKEEMGEWYYNNYFHATFYNYITNEKVKSLAESYRAQFSMVVVKSSYRESMKQSFDEHNVVFEAVKNHDLEKAKSAMKKHFSLGKERLLALYDKK